MYDITSEYNYAANRQGEAESINTSYNRELHNNFIPRRPAKSKSTANVLSSRLLHRYSPYGGYISS